MAVKETGASRWMHKHDVPKRVRGDRAKEISKALTQVLHRALASRCGKMDMWIWAFYGAPRFWKQWITEAEIIDVIHHNQKNRFEVQPKDGAYQVRASQGHSVSHVRDDLILTVLSVDDTPEHAAHGTYYDFYEST